MIFLANADANPASESSEIEFDSSVFSSPQTIILGATPRAFRHGRPEEIDGPGAGLLTISGGGSGIVFDIDSGVTAAISGVTVSGGLGPRGTYGGGLVNHGTLTLTSCTISGNTAADGGGGLMNYDTAMLTGCTISDNYASFGGGIDNEGSATLTNCTISGNSAFGNGGISNSGTMSLTNCTISGNFGSAGVGGLYASPYDGADTDLVNTIVAGNTKFDGSASDISGAVTGSFNLIGTGGAGGLVNGEDGNIVLTTISRLGLSPLGDYGGPTPTVALLPGSPAIGAGTAVSGITTDQRGEPLASPPDIGAFQSQGFKFTLVAGSTPQQTTDGTAFANSLAVVLTANNPIEPVAGGTVTFTAPSSGASAALTSGAATIGADGIAAVIAADNSIAGAYTVTASDTGITSVSFNLTNLVSSLVSVYTVNSTGGGISGSGSAGTLPYVVFLTNANANPDADGSEIVFDPTVFSSPQTITLGATLELTETSGTDEIVGPGPGLVTVSGGATVSVFQVDNGVTASLSGLTISGGSTTGYGGGLANDGTATLTDCTIASDTSFDGGGGVYNAGGSSLTLDGCTIADDSAGFYGGGIDNNGSAAISNSTVDSNTAELVGGGLGNNGVAVITGCTFSDNTAWDGGAGMATFSNGTSTLTGVTLSGNSTQGRGGGVYDSFGTIALTGCTVSGNSANGGGGGLANDQGIASLTDCALEGNYGVSFGGGLWGLAATTTLTAVNVSGNHASEGGGLYAEQGTATLTDCTISGNSAEFGGGVDGGVDLSGATMILTNCTVSGNSAYEGGGLDSSGSTATLTNCTISGNSAHSGAGLINSNGTTTLTDCTISGNSAADNGGGLDNIGTSTLTNCTISGNSATEGYGGGVYTPDTRRDHANQLHRQRQFRLSRRRPGRHERDDDHR